MSQVLDILTLQEIDDEVATLRSSLAAVEQRLHSNQELNDARRVLEHAGGELARLQRQQRRLDGDIGALATRVNGEERRLYDGSIKSPKELSSLQHEVELLRKQLANLEDQVLEVMTAVEGQEERRERAAAGLASVERRWEAERARLEAEAQALRSRLEEGEGHRTTQQAKVPARALALYEDLRRRKGGLAVARIRGGACSGCRVALPAGLRHQAMAQDSLAQCPNCERILAVS